MWCKARGTGFSREGDISDEENLAYLMASSRLKPVPLGICIPVGLTQLPCINHMHTRANHVFGIVLSL